MAEGSAATQQQLATLYHICAGSYEKAIFGFDFNAVLENGEISFNYKTKYAYSPHLGAVKALAISKTGKYLASGATDDYIRLYHLPKKIELGTLSEHQGTITSLTFFKDTYLLSASDDKIINVWRTKDWSLVKSLKGHKDHVISIACHPSGRLALSLSRDKKLMLWNLMKGNCALTKKLSEEAFALRWDPTGESYSILYTHHVEVYSTTAPTPIATIKIADSRINCTDFLGRDHLAVGLEDGRALVYALETPQSTDETDNGLILTIKAHTQRIRGICSQRSPVSKERYTLFTASTDGFVRAWNVCPPASCSGETLATEDSLVEIDTTCRLTCLAVIPGTSQTAKPKISAHRDLSGGAAYDDDVDHNDDDDDDDSDVVVVEKPAKKKRANK